MYFTIRTSTDTPYQVKNDSLSAFGIIIGHSNLTATFTIETPIDLRLLSLNFDWIISIKEYKLSPRQLQHLSPRNKLEGT